MIKYESQNPTFEYLLCKLDVKYGTIVRCVKILKELLSKLDVNQLDDFRLSSQIGLVHERWKEYDDLTSLVNELIISLINKGDIKHVKLYRDSDNKHYLVELE